MGDLCNDYLDSEANNRGGDGILDTKTSSLLKGIGGWIYRWPG